MQQNAASDSQVLAAAAAGFERYVAQAGGDPDVVLGKVGLQSDDLADPTTALPLSRYCAMLDLAARETRDPNFGLRYGRQFQPHMFGLIGFIALASPTVGSALQNFIELFPWHQNGTQSRIVVGPDFVRVEYRILDPAIIDRRQDAEFTLAAFVNVVRACMGAHWTPVQIAFEHPQPEAVADHFQIFDADIAFLQPTNALVMRTERLDLPMPNGNLPLLDVLRSSLEALGRRRDDADLVIRARAEIRGRIATQSIALRDVADRLHVPFWTLQRRLADQGRTYSALVDEVRKDLATLYLGQRHIPISDVAYFLGYSEPSAFSRAFRQWHDLSPQSYRKLHNMTR